MFAIITVALISGAISDRAKFGGWLLFAFAAVHHRLRPGRPLDRGWRLGSPRARLRWTSPVAPAVHINAGSAALGLALVLGKRVG